MEDTNALVSELAEAAVTECIMLDECRELLASTAAMQVKMTFSNGKASVTFSNF